MVNVKATWLASIKELKEVPENQLQWFLDQSTVTLLKSGEILMKPGDKILNTSILLSGKLRIYSIQNGNMIELIVLQEGDITGYLPFSRGYTASIFVESIVDSEVLNFPVEKINEMIHNKFELTQALVHVMTTRVRETTNLQQQIDKMMALGKLSAGLAHELNNPAAALVRSSATLKAHLKSSPEKIKTVLNLNLSILNFEYICAALLSFLQRQEDKPLSLLARTDLEDETASWLKTNKIENCDELAETLVEYHATLEDLEKLKLQLSSNNLSQVLNWINGMLVTDRMVLDIETSSARISDLVKSVKIFTHMDQGHDRQLTDLHSGIQNTLRMLDYRLKKGNIKLIRNFDPELPSINAMVGELNQVWNNIIDNALDAMEEQGSGTIEISSSFDSQFVQIIFSDTGPGIPENIVNNVFDPFFTTKDIGKGTGMGLDMVSRIIRQHHGSIRVDSKPGSTRFTICLPLITKSKD